MNLDFKMYIFHMFAIAFAMTLHEYSKAVISKRLGDLTPERHGRITLNPLKQIEPIGFFVMLVFGYGWSKPMDTNGFFYKDWKKGTIITYLTPSLINLVIGMMFSICFTVFSATFDTSGGVTYYFAELLNAMATFNIALAVFNMIPVYPMDAYRVLLAFLPPNKRIKVSNYEKIFMVVMLLLLFSGVLPRVLDIFTNAFMV